MWYLKDGLNAEDRWKPRLKCALNRCQKKVNPRPGIRARSELHFRDSANHDVKKDELKKGENVAVGHERAGLWGKKNWAEASDRDVRVILRRG